MREDVYANGVDGALAIAGGEGWELVSLKYEAQECGYGYALVFKRPVYTQRKTYPFPPGGPPTYETRDDD